MMMPFRILSGLALLAVLGGCNSSDATDASVPADARIRLTLIGPDMPIGTTWPTYYNLTGVPAYAAVTWRSSNPTVATVDAGGNVMARAAGFSWIVVALQASDRVRDSAQVHVFVSETSRVGE